MPIPDPIITALQDSFRENQVLIEKEDLIPYSFDSTATLKTLPRAVVMVESVEDVQRLLRLSREKGFAVIPRGSGTGLSGGSVPSDGSVVLNILRMDRILEVDTRNLTLMAEAGAITEEVAAAAGRHGLFYPPDPSSMKASTIGGNVANNSGGLRGLKYGVTRNYVMGMQVVLPDGEAIWLGNKCVKDVAGYSLKDLFIGSEGTLGVITRVLLRICPRPAAQKTLLALFDSVEAAGDAVSAIIAEKIIPCTLEFLDRTTLECVESFARVGLPTDVEALLLMETDGHEQVVREEAAAMERIAHHAGAREVRVAVDELDAARLATARRSAFSALARVQPTTILEDVTVPRSELTAMVAFVRETAARHRLRIANFGHMGDGNLHPTFLTNERNPEEMARVELAMDEIFAKAVELGGTITGEHGVGLAKKNHLSLQYCDHSLHLLRQIKGILDPGNLLNPGKIFDLKNG